MGGSAGVGITPYAQDGYFLFATGPNGGQNGSGVGTDISVVPSDVNNVALPASKGVDEATGYNYAQVNTPSSGLVTTGTTSGSSLADQFSFSLITAVPTFTLGVLVDNLNGTIYNAASLTVTDVTQSVTLTQTEVAGNNNPDLYTFVITGALAGDVIRVGSTGPNGDGTYATIAGVTLPEPASLSLLALSGLGMLVRRRNA